MVEKGKAPQEGPDPLPPRKWCCRPYDVGLGKQGLCPASPFSCTPVHRMAMCVVAQSQVAADEPLLFCLLSRRPTPRVVRVSSWCGQ